MNLKTALTILTTLALSFTFAFAAEEDTPLAKEMKVMNKSLRTLKRQIADPSKKDDNLALIATIRKTLENAMKLEPAKTKDIPAAEKAAYVDKYKAQLTDLGKTYEELEASIKAGKTEEVQKFFEKLSEQKEKGHKDFGVDEE